MIFILAYNREDFLSNVPDGYFSDSVVHADTITRMRRYNVTAIIVTLGFWERKDAMELYQFANSRLNITKIKSQRPLQVIFPRIKIKAELRTTPFGWYGEIYMNSGKCESMMGVEAKTKAQANTSMIKCFRMCLKTLDNQLKEHGIL